MKYMLIGIYGVLADLEGDIVGRLVKEFGYIGEANRYESNILERFTRKDVFDRALSYLENEDVYRCLNPDMGAVKFVLDAGSRDYDVAFMIEDQRLERVAEKWLKKIMGISRPEILVVDEEADLGLIGSHVAFLVDDSPTMVRSYLRLGKPAFSWEQHWNMDVFPKIWTDRNNEAVLQESESASEGIYFWNYVEENMK